LVFYRRRKVRHISPIAKDNLKKIFEERQNHLETHAGISILAPKGKMKATRFCRLISTLSQMAAPVATTYCKSPQDICPPPQIAILLHRRTEQTTSERQDKKVSITI
jgi:hypothetical protein